jgi:hypothetical protein
MLMHKPPDSKYQPNIIFMQKIVVDNMEIKTQGHVIGQYEQHKPLLKCVPEGYTVPAPLVASVMFLLL